MNKGNLSDLNKLNTNDLINRLSPTKTNDKKDSPIDIRKLIQQKTIQAQQLKKNNNPSTITSLNFNDISRGKPRGPDQGINNQQNMGQASPTPSASKFPQPKMKGNIQIEQEEQDADEEYDDEIDDEDDNDYEIDDDEDDIPTKNNKKGGPQSPQKIILQEDDGGRKVPSEIPSRPKDVKLPPNIDFGLDKIANKDVLGAISDGEEDDDEAAKKLFQSKKSQKNTSDEEDDEDVDEDEDEDEDGENVPPLSLNGGQKNKSDNASAAPSSPNKEPNDDEGEDDMEDDDPDNQSETALNLGGEDGNADSDDEDAKPKKVKRKMSRHELNVAKRKELTKIERLEKKGYKPCKKYGMADNYDDMVAERERLEDEKGCDESIKWQRKILMGVSTGIEYLNRVYDPFDLQLDGWSESVYENISDYDEVFEELYHKYKKKVKVAPEIKLIGMFAGSALMFHFSKTLFSKASDQVPGFDDVMRDNPDIKAAYEQAALRKMNMNNNQANTPMSSMIGNFFGNPMIGNMIGGLLNRPQAPQPTQAQIPHGPQQGHPQMQQGHPQMQQGHPPMQQGHPQMQQGHPQQSRPPMQQGFPQMQRPQQSQLQQRPQQSQLQQRPPTQTKQPLITPINHKQPSSHQQLTSPITNQQPASPTANSQINNSQMDKAKQIEMDGPSGVDDLLTSLTKGTNADLTELQLSDADTDGTLSEIGSNIKTVSFPNKRTTRTNNRRKRLNLNGD